MAGAPVGNPSQTGDFPRTDGEPNFWNFRLELYSALATGGGTFSLVSNPFEKGADGAQPMVDHFTEWLAVMAEFSKFCKEAVETTKWASMRATLVGFQHSISFDKNNVLLNQWGHMDGNSLSRGEKVNLAGLTPGQWLARTYNMRDGILISEEVIELADDPVNYTYAAYKILDGPNFAVLSLQTPAENAKETLATAALNEAYDQALVGKRILAATGGARTRVAWTTTSVEEDGETYGVLMGIDTADGKSRELARAEKGFGWAMPQIRNDGKYVLVSKNQDGINKGCLAVEWETGEVKKLAEGPYSFGLSWWQDPKTERWYIFVGDNDRTSWEESKGATDKIYKAPFDNMGDRTLFWEESNVSVWWNVSRDGRFAGGAMPFNKMGVANLEDRSYKIHGEGCNGGVSPDNLYLVSFLEGNHRNLRIVEADGSDPRAIRIDTMPLVKGRHPVWLPQWATETRFFTLMGPETGGVSQIHFGRFDKDLTRVERWVQITDSPQASSRSHAWVDPGTLFKVGEDPEGAIADPVTAEEVARTAQPATPTVTIPEWPNLAEDLIFAWSEENNRALALNKKGGKLNAFFFDRKKTARFDQDRLMVTAGGWFVGDGAHIWNHRGADGGFTLALGFRRLASAGTPTGLVLGFSDNGNSEWKLFDVAGMLWLRAGATNLQLGSIVPGGNTLIIAYENQSLRIMFNGQSKTFPMGNVLPPTASDQIFIGATEDGKNLWQGGVDGLAVYRRALSAADFKTLAKGLDDLRAARMDRNKSVLDVTATLMAVSSTPKLEEIRPYTRSLSVFQWKVDQVHAGNANPGDTLNVLTWTLMDSQRLVASGSQPGVKQRLLLGNYDTHEAIQSERFTDDLTEGMDAMFVNQSDER